MGHTYVNNLPMKLLIIDDIADTGKTLEHYVDDTIFTIHCHKQSIVKPDYYVWDKYDKWIVYPGIGKSVGGKGIATTTEDFLDDQWSDSWCSMGSDKKFWEDYADATDVSGNRWEDSYNSWNNKRWVGTGANQLSSGLSTAVDIDAGFLYIKNLVVDPNLHVPTLQ